MTRSAKKKIKELCGTEIKFVTDYGDTVEIKVPYDRGPRFIDVIGRTTTEQVNSFVFGVNEELESMIDHLEDCKFQEER